MTAETKNILIVGGAVMVGGILYAVFHHRASAVASEDAESGNTGGLQVTPLSAIPGVGSLDIEGLLADLAHDSGGTTGPTTETGTTGGSQPGTTTGGTTTTTGGTTTTTGATTSSSGSPTGNYTGGYYGSTRTGGATTRYNSTQ